MKTAIDRLSSLGLTLLLLGLLGAWVAGGVALAASAGGRRAFFAMNGTLVRYWLAAPDSGPLIVKIWFVGLCFLTALLALNLVFCSWNRILGAFRTRMSGWKLLLLSVHVLFGLVVLLHFGGFMLGFRQETTLSAGAEPVSFGQGFELEVLGIRFVDEPSILKKSRQDLTSDAFHHRDNCIEVALRHEGVEIARQSVFLMRPMQHGGIRVTLMRFVEAGPQGQAGGVFAISWNPFERAFLWLYAGMILGMALYLGATWRGSVPDGARNGSRKEEGICNGGVGGT